MKCLAIFILCTIAFVFAETEKRSLKIDQETAPALQVPSLVNEKKQDKRYIHSYYSGVGTGYGNDGLYNNAIGSYGSGYGGYGGYGTGYGGGYGGYGGYGGSYPAISYSNYNLGTGVGGYGGYGGYGGGYGGYGGGYGGIGGYGSGYGAGYGYGSRYYNPYRVSGLGYSGYSNYNGYPYYSTYAGIGNNYPYSRAGGYGNYGYY